MKVLGTIFGGNLNEVATGISLGIRGINSAGSMEWLMDVSNVVDEETNGIRETLFLRE